MQVPVRTTPQAEVQAEEAAAWWRVNRPAAPTLFADELAGALDLLGGAPDLGRRYRRVRIPGLRRLLLPVTLYHVYYVHDVRAAECVVLAVWSALRGRLPRLRRP